ncbi:MAG: Gfo/Idh/MocA family oxidoreductase, partial [Lentisphaerae bacterium]|nr:Gfo/Idh/MocA family oxidoreductase [Lentisphaerota bacterium]
MQKRYARARDIKTATIGFGGAYSIGSVHLREMQRAGMRPVAVAEIDPARRRVAEAEFPGIRTYATAGAMLEQSDADLVAVITPHHLHAELALQCLRAGRHVVCEKPFALTTAECNSMIREARRRGLLLSTYHNRHWDGSIRRAVRMIRERNVIGDVYRVEAHMGAFKEPVPTWRSSKSRSGGILYDWGVHLLEYSLQLLDGDIEEVTGYARRGYWASRLKWKRDTNEDEAFAVVRFSSGQWLTLTVSSLDANPKMTDRGFLEITGTQGAYIMHHDRYTLIRPRGKKTAARTGKNLKNRWSGFYRNIADHLVNAAPLVITPEWAR